MSPPHPRARLALGVLCRLDTNLIPLVDWKTHCFASMVTRTPGLVSSLTLLLWGLRKLRGESEPDPKTLSKYRLEAHSGPPGLLFSPVQSQVQCYPSLPGRGTPPRATRVGIQVPHRAPSHLGQANPRPDVASGV